MSAGRPMRETDALTSWGRALRQRRAHRRLLLLRAVWTGAGCAALIATAVLPPAPRWVWNASASAPIGLYHVDPGAPLSRGDMVVAWPPVAVRSLAARRHYLPLGVPLVKRIAAAAGDEVCAIGPRLFLNGDPLADRRPVDAAGRPLAWWTGCRRLRGGEFLLLMPENPASFDGRYFGLTDRREVLGRARLLWPR